MTDPSWLEIDLSRLAHNVNALKARMAHEKPQPARGGRLCAVVKKDAYGQGAVPIAHRLARCGVDMLAVYNDAEARELVAGAVALPILVLSPMNGLGRTDVLYRHAVASKLHLSIHDLDQARAVNQLGHTFGIKLPCHLHLDTGMSRSGLSRAQFDGLLAGLDDYPFLRPAGIWTHMATADDAPDFLAQQMDRFEAAVAANADHLTGDTVLHAANTFATLRDRRYHLDMIRPGLGLYGHGPRWLTPNQPVIDDVPPLQPITRWLSRIIHSQPYPKGTTVGYNRLHTLKRRSIVGIVPVGYGDGYPVALSNKAVVRLLREDGSAIDCPVLGKVSMDQITIDLTRAIDKDADPAVLKGRTVEIYANDPDAPNAVCTLAMAIGSHPYELLCRLSPRIKRHYVN